MSFDRPPRESGEEGVGHQRGRKTPINLHSISYNDNQWMSICFQSVRSFCVVCLSVFCVDGQEMRARDNPSVTMIGSSISCRDRIRPKNQFLKQQQQRRQKKITESNEWHDRLGRWNSVDWSLFFFVGIPPAVPRWRREEKEEETHAPWCLLYGHPTKKSNKKEKQNRKGRKRKKKKEKKKFLKCWGREREGERVRERESKLHAINSLVGLFLPQRQNDELSCPIKK